MALQSREDPMDTHLACKWEPGWPSPHAEPLAHTLSLSLLSRTRELLQARQRLCPARRQEASKRSKEPGLLACLLLGFFYQFPREINSLHMPDSFSKYTAKSNHSPPQPLHHPQPGTTTIKHQNSSHPACSESGLGGKAMPKHSVALGHAHFSSLPFQRTNHQLQLPSSAIFFQPEVGQSN